MIDKVREGREWVLFIKFISVFFYSPQAGNVEAISIGIPDKKFYGETAEFYKQFYQNLAKELHQILQAKRTSFGWESLEDECMFE